MLRLILPDSAYLASYIDALEEGYKPFVRVTIDEATIQTIKADPADHFELLNCQGGYTSFSDGIPFERVPLMHFWLVDDETKMFFGAIDCRFGLNDRLRQIGGHIGYNVRPLMRCKGYAKAMVKMALPKFLQRGIDRVLIVCGDKNLASIKVTEFSGGVMEDKVPNPFPQDGPLARRYWIDLKDSGAPKR